MVMATNRLLMGTQEFGVRPMLQGAAPGVGMGTPGVQTAPVSSQTPVPPAGMPPLPQTLAPPASSAPGPSPTDALNNFANSAGMQFQMQQGANALNNLYAAHGQVQSGAAAKALQSYGQNTALQNYFMPYMNYLQGQQNSGISAGSSIAGVGSSFGNTAAGINQNSANALGQGALNIGNANANRAAINGLGASNLYGAIGSGLGSVGAALFRGGGGSIPSPNLSAPMSTSFGTPQPLPSMTGFY